MNETSSRSHSVFTIKLVHKRDKDKEAAGAPIDPSEVTPYRGTLLIRNTHPPRITIGP